MPFIALTGTGQQANFEVNDYFATDSNVRINWGTQYTSLDSWRSATGKERDLCVLPIRVGVTARSAEENLKDPGWRRGYRA